MPTKSKQKNLLLTKTVIGAVISLATVITMAHANISSLITRHTTYDKDDIRDVMAIVVAVASFTLTVYGRHDAGDKPYTPRWLIGRNRDEDDSVDGDDEVDNKSGEDEEDSEDSLGVNSHIKEEEEEEEEDWVKDEAGYIYGEFVDD